MFTKCLTLLPLSLVSVTILNYLQPSQRAAMKDVLLRAVQSATGEQESPPSAASSSSCNPDDDSLFSFMSHTAAANSASSMLTAEVDSYLASHLTDTASLLAFPHIAVAFRKYNAAPPSSTAVERLISTAGQVLTSRRCKMTDALFEQAVFLRYKLKDELDD